MRSQPEKPSREQHQMKEPATLEEVRSYILAAIIHQARQPVFVLQNDLFAARHLVERIGDTPDSLLLRECVSEMRKTLDRISASLSLIAEFALPSASGTREITAKAFLEETFQIVRFCASRNNIQLSTDASKVTEAPMTFDRMKVRITLVQWVICACGEMLADSPYETKASLTAESLENEVVIFWNCSSFERQLLLPGDSSGVLTDSRD